MSRDPFARAAKSILGRLGGDALLRGAPAGKVNVEHGVDVYEKNEQGESLFSRSVATIERQYAPKRGDTLVVDEDRDGVPEATYLIGGLFQDNGHTVRHIVTPVAGA